MADSFREQSATIKVPQHQAEGCKAFAGVVAPIFM